jgi:hypothetical protein
MESIRFETLTRLVGAAGSRRQALRLLAGICLGTGVAHTPGLRPAAAQGTNCRVARSPCRRDNQCCSQECRKRTGRKLGKCTSLGRLAANCTPPPATCSDQSVLPQCQVNGANGTCFPTLSNEVICADSLQCNTNTGSPPVCDEDADCVSFGAKSRCIDTCANSICIGLRACATYAGEG